MVEDAIVLLCTYVYIGCNERYPVVTELWTAITDKWISLIVNYS